MIYVNKMLEIPASSFSSFSNPNLNFWSSFLFLTSAKTQFHIFPSPCMILFVLITFLEKRKIKGKRVFRVWSSIYNHGNAIVAADIRQNWDKERNKKEDAKENKESWRV